MLKIYLKILILKIIIIIIKIIFFLKHLIGIKLLNYNNTPHY